MIEGSARLAQALGPRVAPVIYIFTFQLTCPFILYPCTFILDPYSFPSACSLITIYCSPFFDLRPLKSNCTALASNLKPPTAAGAAPNP
jgi:hypothetical protein